jgi:hypothetical protein
MKIKKLNTEKGYPQQVFIDKINEILFKVNLLARLRIKEINRMARDRP